MPPTPSHRLASVLLAVGGCGKDVEVGDLFGSGTHDGTADTSGRAGTEGGAATTAALDDGATQEGPASDTEVKFDLGSAGDSGLGCDPDDPECHCTAVDVVFVVDNSGSMQEHAPGVKASFDTFVEEMVTVLPLQTSLHVGITRATGFYDPGDSGGWNTVTCAAAQVDGTWNPPDVANNGTNGQQGRLFEHEGKRFFDLDTGADPQALKDWFGGALSASIDPWDPHSNTETVLAGAAYPFHPVNATFNQGFLREQAVLVIFLLSDSSDLSPESVPTSDFIDMVSDAKSGCGDQCILLSAAIPEVCFENPENTNTRYTEFLNGFGKPPASLVDLPASGDTPDFDGVLGAALAEVITTTCDQIPPAG